MLLVSRIPCNLFQIQKLECRKYIKSRFFSTVESAQRRSKLFSAEKRKQLEKVGRVEKIEVRYLGVPNDTTLIMNKGLSTPYNCAQHLGEHHCKKSALALIDNKTPWDMHRPLSESCTIQLLNFTIPEPHLVNKAFWRTCSFLLGAALQNAFKDMAGLFLHSFPSPNVKSGSYVYDIVLSHNDWTPTKIELRTLSANMIKLAAQDLPIERLDIDQELAHDMFKDNPYKREQLPSISNQSNNRSISVYRVGDHVDISRGPMIGSTGLLGKTTIAQVHKTATDKGMPFYRVQGISLPVGFMLNHFAFGVLADRACKLNPARLPTEPYDEISMESAIA